MPIAYEKYQKINNVETVFVFAPLLANHQQVLGHEKFSLQLALELQKNVFLYDETQTRW